MTSPSPRDGGRHPLERSFYALLVLCQLFFVGGRSGAGSRVDDVLREAAELARRLVEGAADSKNVVQLEEKRENFSFLRFLNGVV